MCVHVFVCVCACVCVCVNVWVFVLIVLNVPTTVFSYIVVTSAGLEIHPVGWTMAGWRGFHPPGVCTVCM